VVVFDTAANWLSCLVLRLLKEHERQPSRDYRALQSAELMGLAVPVDAATDGVRVGS